MGVLQELKRMRDGGEGQVQGGRAYEQAALAAA